MTDRLKCLFQDSQVERGDVEMCREALDTLTICMALHPQALETLKKEKTWQNFIIDMLVRCRIRGVRMQAAEQFALTATKCSSTHRPQIFFITLLFAVLQSVPKEYPLQSHEYFQLINRSVG